MDNHVSVLTITRIKQIKVFSLFVIRLEFFFFLRIIHSISISFSRSFLYIRNDYYFRFIIKRNLIFYYKLNDIILLHK